MMVEASGESVRPPSTPKGLLLPVFFIVVFICAAFAGSAALLLWVRFVTGGFTEDPGFLVRLFAKGVFFSALALGSIAWFTRSRHAVGEPGSFPQIREGMTPYALATVCIALAAAVLLSLPRLDAYPWSAPDELHHLIVARNLAEHQVYASGRPDTEFVRFDPYDSVGVPLLGPVAGVFKVAGTGIVPARLVVAVSYWLLCILVFFLFRPVFGPAHAGWAVFMLTASYGSVYFARSVYGEVTSFMFVVAGLLAWRRAIRANKGYAMALFAGLLFGLAVLTKVFLLISAWAFVGVLIYDGLTFRRIRFRQTLLMAAGVVVPMAAWWWVEAVYGDPDAPEFSLLSEYRHSLIFGLGSAKVGLGWLLKQPVTLAVSSAAMLWAIPEIFRRKYDPPMMVLLLSGILFVFWWVFCTPGHIPRYIWYSCAVVGLFSGLFLETCRGWVMDSGVRPALRLAALLTVAGILCTGLLRTYDSAVKVYRSDELADEFALADYVGSLPGETRVATTFWLVERSINFFADRRVTWLNGPEDALAEFDVVIRDDVTEEIPASVLEASRRIGRYVIVTPKGDSAPH